MPGLEEWTDLLDDMITVTQQTGSDEWGNPVFVTSVPIEGKVLSGHSKRGGSSDESEREHKDQWTITLVIPEMNPVPEVNEVIGVNGTDYTISSVTIHEDEIGKAIEIQATNTEVVGEPS